MNSSLLIKRSVYSALVFFGTLLALSVGYATYSSMTTVDSGEPLTKDLWNQMVGNLEDHEGRISEIAVGLTSLSGSVEGVTSTVASLSNSVSTLQVNAGNLWTTVTGGIGYSAGNVGIGTTAPGSSLHVYRDTGNNAEIDIQSTAGAGKHWAIYNDRASNGLRFWNNDISGEKNALTLGNNGNVGIGTVSPGYKLDITGTVNATAFRGDGSQLSNISTPWSGISGKPTTVSAFTNDSGYLTAGFASTSGQPASTTLANETGYGAFQAQSQGSAGTAGAAFMSFHRPWAFAAYFGLDTDNQFKVGGWSMGTAAYALLHSGNYSSYSPTLTGIGASGTWGIGISGNAATATNLSANRSNWSGNGTISAVVGQLSWKNYGNNHTIFDASASTSPDGTAVNNTNSAVAWSASYPTLMGWNGANTYGVRVDSARVADSVAWAGITGKPTTFGGVTAVTSATCSTYSSYCTANCPAWYYRTGCSPSYNSAVTALTANGCTFYGNEEYSRSQFTICAK